MTLFKSLNKLSTWFAFLAVTLLPLAALAQEEAEAEGAHHGGGEANLIVPDLSTVEVLGMSGHSLLLAGLLVAALGIGFGVMALFQVKNLPAHKSMTDVSDLIWETCKTYLITQGKFIMALEVLIGSIIAFYFGSLMDMDALKVIVILLFSVIGILGSYGVAWFGIRMNTYANSRTAFASLKGKPYDVYAIPLKAGMSIGMVLISVELVLMLAILLFIPGDYAGSCFVGFAIGESLGASALRIAGGIFTKIADIGSDLMKIVFKVKEDDARNPGVIADCTGDNAGDSVGPSADGFETYGVTGVALISFIILAVADPAVQVQLLVWIFAMRIMMVVASALAYLGNEAVQKSVISNTKGKVNFEHPLTWLVWVTSIASVALTFAVSYLLIPELGNGDLWWVLSLIISCGTLAGAIIPELVKVFTSTQSAHVAEVVNSSREGGASLNVLSGLTAGNFSGFWLGGTIAALMGGAYYLSGFGLEDLMIAAPVFAFGLVAFGFLGMGPVTIAVDSYGPVTDNAQSVFELSTITEIPGVSEEIEKTYGFKVNFEKAKELLEENDGAGNTFKATAKPVLIGTAVVGATTMIFSIIVLLTHGLTENIDKLSILHPPFLLGMIAGGCIIYWFTGASTQAVVAGAYRAVEFIKRNMKLEGATKASIEDSKKVVEICTRYAQKGMVNIFMTVFFATLAFACAGSFFFIGYLISMALFGLFQALFMANAGGAWDNAKKVVETELKEKNSDLHAAAVVGDTVGDPFKDTSSVAMNPIIKFTTLFGLLAVELTIGLDAGTTLLLTTLFGGLMLFFVWRSFYGMRITPDVAAPSSSSEEPPAAQAATPAE